MAFTPIDFVAQQLRAMNPGAEWGAGGVDRAQELATVLVNSRGVRDMGRLGLQVVKVTTTPAADWLPPEIHAGLAFTYEGGAPWGSIARDQRSTDWELFQSNYGFLVWQSREGHGGVDYVLAPGPLGWSIAPMWFSTSPWGDIRHAVIFLASVYLMAAGAAGTSAGASLGAAILGPTVAAQYPLLAAALGNALISAAMTGTTDLETVAKNAVLSYAGAEAGAQVNQALTDATTLDAIGKIGAAATSTFIRGGDVTAAVRNTLILQTPGVISMLGDSNDYGGDPFANVDTSGYVPTDVNDLYQPAVMTPADLPAGQPAQVPDVSAGIVLPTDLAPYDYSAPQTTPAAIPSVQIEPPSAAPSDAGAFTMKDLTMGVTYAMTAALQLVKAYQQVKAPPVNPIARTVNGSTVIAATDNGLIQTRDASGRVTQTKPAVGQPQLTTTGNLIVNNGDGTYTLIGADGSRRVISYPTNTYLPTIGGGSITNMLSGINPAWLAAGVTIGLAVLPRLFSSKRS